VPRETEEKGEERERSSRAPDLLLDAGFEKLEKKSHQRMEFTQRPYLGAIPLLTLSFASFPSWFLSFTFLSLIFYFATLSICNSNSANDVSTANQDDSLLLRISFSFIFFFGWCLILTHLSCCFCICRVKDDKDIIDHDSDEESTEAPRKRNSGRRKIKIEYIEDKNRRHITFSKRKAGIMKKVSLYDFFFLTSVYTHYHHHSCWEL
jgi:hypothetical protein